jgi:hypothetical protein
MPEPIILKTRRTVIQESVIARLEDAIRAAKKGQYACIAIAAVNQDGSIVTSWSQSDVFARLLGSVARLQFKLNDETEMVEVAQEDDDGPSA